MVELVPAPKQHQGAAVLPTHSSPAGSHLASFSPLSENRKQWCGPMSAVRLLDFTRDWGWILMSAFLFVNAIGFRLGPHSEAAYPTVPALASTTAEASSLGQEHVPIVICLSSIPARLPHLEPILQHLFNQSQPADAVYLALPWWSTRESKFYNIPDFLKEDGEYSSRVKLLRSRSDYGPATKFVPVIKELKRQKMEDARVIIVDDDQEYPGEMVAAYDKWSEILPDSALTMRGHKMLDKPIDWIRIACGNIIHAYELPELTCVDIITAVGSYMIRPRFFTPELWEALYIHETHGDASTRLRGARNADDIWISGMLARNGVPRHVIPGRHKAWQPEQPQEAYFTGMSIHPWEPAVASQSGTPTLSGGSSLENTQLIEAFWDNWSCFGNFTTLPMCPKNAAGDAQEFLHGVPCTRQDGRIMHG